jgi:uncharacterized membrane protein YagU involved in acid resistance
MNCLYITLSLNIVGGIVQTFIKSWNQLLCPRVIEVCRQPLEPGHDFLLQLIIVVELFPSLLGLRTSWVSMLPDFQDNNIFTAGWLSSRIAWHIFWYPGT